MMPSPRDKRAPSSPARTSRWAGVSPPSDDHEVTRAPYASRSLVGRGCCIINRRTVRCISKSYDCKVPNFRKALALNEMAKDDLTTLDAANVLRGGVVEFSEEVNRTWRYRVRTSRMTFVVAFRSEHALSVVT